MFNQDPLFPKTKLILALTYSIPVALIIWFVITFSVDLPVEDDWELIDFFEKIHSGTVNFGDFFAQHNEHRIFFPRIIFAIIAFSSKWNIKVENYFGLLLGLANYLILYKIAASTAYQANKLLFHSFNIAICILCLSLIQFENWLWGFQISWLLINTCVILAIFILNSSKSLVPNSKIVLASICCFIASFSSAHGLLSWLAITPSLYLVEGENKEKKIRFLIWILLFIFCVAIYSIGYQKPTHHPSIFFILQQPFTTFKYFLALLGSSLCKGVFPPVITGLIIFLAFLFLNVSVLKNYRSDFANRSYPWLSLGWFAILFALMTTIGRSGFGIEQAGASRYMSVLILLVISCLQLWRLWILDKWQGDKKYLSLLIVRLCLGFLIALFIFDSSSCIVLGENILRGKNVAKTCLEIINFIQDNSSINNCLNLIYPDQLKVRRLSKTLEKLEFRDFPRNINFISKPDELYGYIDSSTTKLQILNLRKSDILKLSGWAIFPKQKEQPSAIFFSYGNKQLFFAYGFVNLSRPDISKALKSIQYNKSGWAVNASIEYLPLGETTIKAWVYDKKHQKFIQLSGESKIKIIE